MTVVTNHSPVDSLTHKRMQTPARNAARAAGPRSFPNTSAAQQRTTDLHLHLHRPLSPLHSTPLQHPEQPPSS